MNKTTSLFLATLIAGTVLLSFHSASAQEWRMLIDKNIFTANQNTKTFLEKPSLENEWLATQTPLLKNTPISPSNMKGDQGRTPDFESQYSRIGSWAPLQSDPGKENFTLFSF